MRRLHEWTYARVKTILKSDAQSQGYKPIKSVVMDLAGPAANTDFSDKSRKNSLRSWLSLVNQCWERSQPYGSEAEAEAMSVTQSV